MRTRDWLACRAETTPTATALIDARTGKSTAYGALDTSVDTLAGRLARLGIEPGSHVGLLAETSVPAIRAIHAIERLGARTVGLNCRLADPELQRQLTAADVDTVVCDPPEAARAVERFEGPVAVLATDGDACPDGARRIDRIDPAAVEPYEWRLGEPAIVLFTSGTTGDPKPVLLTRRNLLASAVASAFRLGVQPDDRWLLRLAVYHMGGLAPVVRSTLYGTALVVLPTRPSFDPTTLARASRERAVTGVSLVPTMLRRVFEADAELHSGLRFVLLGGAPAPRTLIETCVRRDVPVCPTYGMTETASQIATVRPGEAEAAPESVGRPLMGTSVTVIDDAGRRLPPGDPGELVVDGPTVMAGYYDDEAATEAAFGEFGLHTGDVGYRDESGRVYVLNRRSDRIVTGGENVNPGEVAEAIREHPAVRSVAVVGVEDADLGERVGALVVASDSELTGDDIRAYLRDRLAGYKLPRTVRFVEELPRTPSGTVDREAARALLARDNAD